MRWLWLAKSSAATLTVCFGAWMPCSSLGQPHTAYLPATSHRLLLRACPSMHNLVRQQTACPRWPCLPCSCAVHAWPLLQPGALRTSIMQHGQSGRACSLPCCVPARLPCCVPAWLTPMLPCSPGSNAVFPPGSLSCSRAHSMLCARPAMAAGRRVAHVHCAACEGGCGRAVQCATCVVLCCSEPRRPGRPQRPWAGAGG